MFWIDAAEPSQLASNFSKIAPALRIEPQTQAGDLVANREIAKSWFANATVPWLVVFDNADNLDRLAAYWPCGGHGSILITSRSPFVNAFPSLPVLGIDLEPFTEADATPFVRQVTRCETSEAEQNASLEMARELGCLPLAIVQIAGVIFHDGLTLQSFLEDYQTEYLTFRKMYHNMQLQRLKFPLATAWNFDELDPDATRLLRIMSMLSPDKVSENLLLGSESSLRSTPLFGEREAFKKAKVALLFSSMIKQNKSSDELSIHRIIAQECRASMSSDDLYNIFGLALQTLCAAWPFNVKLEERHATRAKCEAILPHVEHIHKLYGASKSSWINQTHAKNLLNLLRDGGAYLQERGLSYHGAQGKPYIEQGQVWTDKAKALQRELGDDAGNSEL